MYYLYIFLVMKVYFIDTKLIMVFFSVFVLSYHWVCLLSVPRPKPAHCPVKLWLLQTLCNNTWRIAAIWAVQKLHSIIVFQNLFSLILQELVKKISSMKIKIVQICSVVLLIKLKIIITNNPMKTSLIIQLMVSIDNWNGIKFNRHNILSFSVDC